jgi:hypothetical protein
MTIVETFCCPAVGGEVIVGTHCCAKMTKTYMMWHGEHVWNVSLLLKEYTYRM